MLTSLCILSHHIACSVQLYRRFSGMYGIPSIQVHHHKAISGISWKRPQTCSVHKNLYENHLKQARRNLFSNDGTATELILGNIINKESFTYFLAGHWRGLDIDPGRFGERSEVSYQIGQSDISCSRYCLLQDPQNILRHQMPFEVQHPTRMYIMYIHFIKWRVSLNDKWSILSHLQVEMKWNNHFLGIVRGGTDHGNKMMWWSSKLSKLS